jgi:hypothetical protein
MPPSGRAVTISRIVEPAGMSIMFMWFHFWRTQRPAPGAPSARAADITDPDLRRSRMDRPLRSRHTPGGARKIEGLGGAIARGPIRQPLGSNLWGTPRKHGIHQAMTTADPAVKSR